MSIFNELLPKLNEISNTIANNFNDDLKAVFECLDKFEEEYQNGRGRTREKAQKDKMTTLQSINEDDDELNKKTETVLSVDISKSESVTRSSLESNNNEKPRRVSKKRSKHEMDDISSPEQDKRQKRNASVKAQSIISKQVNVNLNQKLRRDVPNETSKGNRKKDEENKENTEPVTPVQS
ncbi:unnamed protein product [Diatraea saccharalis]|uniref:Uncharacterized protein n=1 Tax=Diatraea saccharalis TaxID=40085 RepID=A0A9N9R8P9_9NEOP|nr:unnamed protein product [Diatraea saccharalis]